MRSDVQRSRNVCVSELSERVKGHRMSAGDARHRESAALQSTRNVATCEVQFGRWCSGGGLSLDLADDILLPKTHQHILHYSVRCAYP